METKLADAASAQGTRYYRWDDEGVTFRRWVFGREHFVAWELVEEVSENGYVSWKDGDRGQQAAPPKWGDWFSTRWRELSRVSLQRRVEQINSAGELCGECDAGESQGHLALIFTSGVFIVLVFFMALSGDVWNWSHHAPGLAAAVWGSAAVASGSIAFGFGVALRSAYQRMVFRTRFRRWRITAEGFSSRDEPRTRVPWDRVPREWPDYVCGHPSARALMWALVESARPNTEHPTAQTVLLALLLVSSAGLLVDGARGFVGALGISLYLLVLVGAAQVDRWKHRKRDKAFAKLLCERMKTPTSAASIPQGSRSRDAEQCCELPKVVC